MALLAPVLNGKVLDVNVARVSVGFMALIMWMAEMLSSKSKVDLG